MNDIDFVSELVALIQYNISNKKDKVIALYEKDITPKEKEFLKESRDSFINY
ncbi:MAG: hypothetical protein U5Q03_01530 [Bacteroidota bacterium]|nr:hypothetical protein [Bacteroidota bacterium]